LRNRKMQWSHGININMKCCSFTNISQFIEHINSSKVDVNLELFKYYDLKFLFYDEPNEHMCNSKINCFH
jgi:hypothetical protein